MSSPKKESDLKAGHPPAVKVSGKRITQHKPPKSDDKHLLQDEEINHSGLKIPSSTPTTVSVSGVPIKCNTDFPEAVQAYHDKHHEPRPAHASNKPNIIHQPRK